MTKGSPKEFRKVKTLVDLVQWRAVDQPKTIAYHFWADGETETATITYGEIDTVARAIAVLLQSLGCSGEPVLLLYPPGLDYIVAFLGCLYAGAIAVPAYPPRPNRSLDRLQVMIQDATARVALTNGQVLQSVESQFSECPVLKGLHWLTTDTVDPHLAEAWAPPTVTAEHLALLQYTSGSTGNPKGVMVSHGNLIHNLERIRTLFGHSSASRGVSWLPPYHDMGLVGSILQPIYVGAPMALMPPVAFLQKPLRWLQAISRFGATTSGAPNFAYDLCVQKTTPEQRESLDLRGWEVAFTGAEPVQADTLDRFAAAFAAAGFRQEAFYPCYGMAETTLMVTGAEVRSRPRTYTLDEAALRNHQVIPAAAGQVIVSCGRPPEDQGVCIVDPETCLPCDDGQVGEIWVAASGSVAQGYWRKPELTAQTFQAYTATGEGPFLRTGDLGFVHAGELYVTGRRKELIIIRGRNYYPKDIETTVAATHPALRPGSGAAFSVTVAGQERLVVVQEVERTQLRKLDTDEIVAAVRRAIAEQHDLQLYGLQLLKTGTLPKTSSGKIQRLQCRAGYLDHQLSTVFTWQLDPQALVEVDADTTLGTTGSEGNPAAGAIAPLPTPSHALGAVQSLPDLKAWLVAWVAQTLDLPLTAVDPQRPFAEYGLDSVAAVELTEALQSVIQTPLSPTLAYEYPTIEAVATYLGAQMGMMSPESPSHSPASAQDDDDLTTLVDELADLSAAEVEELLGQQGR